MRKLLSNDRRRRLRLIQAVEKLSEEKFHSAVSALAIASEAETTRHDLEFMRNRLICECRPNSSVRLRVELPGAAPVEVSLDRPYLLIGSDPDCDLHFDHEEVCARHLLMIWIEGQLFCCNISPRASHFPGRETSSTGWWVDHRPIEVGPYRLLLNDGTLDPSDHLPLERSQRLASEYPLLALQFHGVAQKDNIWPINRVLTLIGRDAICKLRLNHKSVAPVQACLLRTAVGCWLINLENEGATLVNGRTMPFTSVDIGDELQLGNFYTEVVTMAVPASAPQESDEKPETSRRLPPNRGPLETSQVWPSTPLTANASVEPVDVIVPEPIAFDNQGRSGDEALNRVRFDRQPKIGATDGLLEDPAEEGLGRGVTVDQCAGPEIIPVPAVDPFEDAIEPNANVESVGQFIQQQELELAALKSQLEELKQTYDAAAGQVISKKLRNSLERPVHEILKSYGSLEMKLSNLIQAIEQKTV